MHHYLLIMGNEDRVFSMRYQVNQKSNSRFQKLKRKCT